MQRSQYYSYSFKIKKKNRTKHKMARLVKSTNCLTEKKNEGICKISKLRIWKYSRISEIISISLITLISPKNAQRKQKRRKPYVGAQVVAVLKLQLLVHQLVSSMAKATITFAPTCIFP